jgi:hypothetical protein
MHWLALADTLMLEPMIASDGRSYERAALTG